MPVSSVVVSDDLGLEIGNARAALTPSQAFTVAEQLIRAATKAIVIDEADRAAVLDTARNPNSLRNRRVATVEPIRLDEIWGQRDVTLAGQHSARIFESFARYTETAEIVVVHRDGADRVVMLSWSFWKRVAATIKLANGDPLPADAAD